MLTPEGESGRSQKRSQSHKLFTKDDPGLKQIFSDCSQWTNMSLALNWLFLDRKEVKKSVGWDALHQKVESLTHSVSNSFYVPPNDWSRALFQIYLYNSCPLHRWFLTLYSKNNDLFWQFLIRAGYVLILVGIELAFWTIGMGWL